MASWHALCGLSRRIWGVAAALVVVVALASVFAGAASASAGVAPNATNELDCNGWSSGYQAVKPDLGGLCTDPIAIKNGKAHGSSTTAGTSGTTSRASSSSPTGPARGNKMTYFMRLADRPARGAYGVGQRDQLRRAERCAVVRAADVRPALLSAEPVQARQRQQLGSISDPNAAGSAFLELQLYPPGFTPFIDSSSCSQTKWCSALTIDSLSARSTSRPATRPAKSPSTSPISRTTASRPDRRARS